MNMHEDAIVTWIRSSYLAMVRLLMARQAPEVAAAAVRVHGTTEVV
jgi:hypothetical protein